MCFNLSFQEVSSHRQVAVSAAVSALEEASAMESVLLCLQYVFSISSLTGFVTRVCESLIIYGFDPSGPLPSCVIQLRNYLQEK